MSTILDETRLSDRNFMILYVVSVMQYFYFEFFSIPKGICEMSFLRYITRLTRYVQVKDYPVI